MNKNIWMAVACLSAAIGLGTMPAAAETLDTVRVDLPYATTVGGVALPAGSYSIRDINIAGASAVFQISSTEKNGVKAVVFGRQIMASKNDSTKVVLKQDENGSYKLQQVWVAGQDFGFDLSAE